MKQSGRVILCSTPELKPRPTDPSGANFLRLGVGVEAGLNERVRGRAGGAGQGGGAGADPLAVRRPERHHAGGAAGRVVHREGDDHWHAGRGAPPLSHSSCSTALLMTHRCAAGGTCFACFAYRTVGDWNEVEN